MAHASRSDGQLKLAGNLQTRAAFEPSSFNAEKGTAEVVFTTGARGLRQPWFGDDYYEELEVSEQAVDLSRLNNGASLLAAHDGYSLSGVIGVVERAWIAGKEGRALVRFSDREDVKPIRSDVASGVLRHVSVGYTVQKYEKTEEEGNRIPILRATRWTPAEISLVPIAFDDAATVRSGAPQPKPYEVEVITITQERTMVDPKQTSIPAVVPAPAPVADSAAPVASGAAEPVDATRTAELAVAAERERASAIRSLVSRQTLIPEAERATLATELVDKGVPIEQARTAILDRVATESEKFQTDQHVRIDAGEDAREKFRRGATAAIFRRAGLTALAQQAAKLWPDLNLAVDDDPGEFRGASYSDLARRALEFQGVQHKGRDRESLLKLALTRAGQYQTTSDFPILLDSSWGKALTIGYVLQPTTWPRFCGRDLVSDFRESNRYRPGSIGDLEEINESGEVPTGKLHDGEKVAVSVKEHGKIVGLSRKALINDDMNVFASVAMELGRVAARGVEKAVYAALAENSGLGPEMSDALPLFDAGHSNIGTGSAITMAGLEADVVLMAYQTDPGGEDILDLSPTKLLVPKGLEGTARSINEAQYDPDTANKLQKPNQVRGQFDDIIGSARLAAASTRRYLFADPSQYPALKAIFLEGYETPQIEQQVGFEVLGVKWRVIFDWQVLPFDYRSAVTNAGAA
jgi:hypothetical protein